MKGVQPPPNNVLVYVSKLESKAFGLGKNAAQERTGQAEQARLFQLYFQSRQHVFSG